MAEKRKTEEIEKNPGSEEEILESYDVYEVNEEGFVDSAHEISHEVNAFDVHRIELIAEESSSENCGTNTTPPHIVELPDDARASETLTIFPIASKRSLCDTDSENNSKKIRPPPSKKPKSPSDEMAEDHRCSAAIEAAKHPAPDPRSTRKKAQRQKKVAEPRRSVETDISDGAIADVEDNTQSPPRGPHVVSPPTDQPNPEPPTVTAGPSGSLKTGKAKLKCLVCKKKLGLTAITCRCGGLFCATHRYVNEHDCSFDYRAMGAEEIRKNNPLVIAEKVTKL